MVAVVVVTREHCHQANNFDIESKGEPNRSSDWKGDSGLNAYWSFFLEKIRSFC